MISTPDLAGLVMWLGVLPAIYFIRKTWNQQSKPGIVWFQTMMFAEGAWAFAFGLLTILDDPGLTLAIARVDVFLVTLAAVGWFLMSVEYASKRTVSYEALGLLLVLPFILQLAVWTNPSHHLVFAEGTTVDQSGVLHIEVGPLLLLDTLYATLLVFMTFGILLAEFVRSEPSEKRRTQTVYLLVATVVLIVTGLLYTLGLTPAYLNAGPLGFVLAGMLLYQAFTRYDLIQIAPAARDEIVEEVNDAVLMINNDGIIADANRRARELFDLPTDYAGVSRSTLFDEHHALEKAGEGSEETITLELDGEERHFQTATTSVEYGRDMRGEILVLSEVSALKERELELALLKQINTRVFRHNFRNELSIIDGNSDVLVDNLDDEHARYAEKIAASSETLLSHSETAKDLSEVIENGDEITDYALSDQVEAGLAEIDDVGVDIETNVPDDIVVESHVDLEKAVREAVENAGTHNDRRVTVEIYTETRGENVVLFIEDDGCGISQSEIGVLTTERETSIRHGSGVGLWLIRWVAQKSNGELLIESDGGTRLGIELPLAESAANRDEQ